VGAAIVSCAQRVPGVPDHDGRAHIVHGVQLAVGEVRHATDPDSTWHVTSPRLGFLRAAANETLSRAIEIRDGRVVNPAILAFQGRATESPYTFVIRDGSGAGEPRPAAYRPLCSCHTIRRTPAARRIATPRTGRIHLPMGQSS
jgi:hypothetical protein